MMGLSTSKLGLCCAQYELASKLPFMVNSDNSLVELKCKANI